MKPKLIDELTYEKLEEQDREDYVKSVKEYNRTGDKIFLSAALYFEGGKINQNRKINRALHKMVQREIHRASEHLSTRQIASMCDTTASKINIVMSGYTQGVTDELLSELLKKLRTKKGVAA